MTAAEPLSKRTAILQEHAGASRSHRPRPNAPHCRSSRHRRRGPWPGACLSYDARLVAGGPRTGDGAPRPPGADGPHGPPLLLPGVFPRPSGGGGLHIEDNVVAAGAAREFSLHDGAVIWVRAIGRTTCAQRAEKRFDKTGDEYMSFVAQREQPLRTALPLLAGARGREAPAHAPAPARLHVWTLLGCSSSSRAQMRRFTSPHIGAGLAFRRTQRRHGQVQHLGNL